MGFKINLGDLVVRLVGDKTPFQRMMEDATRSVSRMGRDLQRVGRTLSDTFTRPLAEIAESSISAALGLDAAALKGRSLARVLASPLDRELSKASKEIGSMLVPTIATAVEVGRTFLNWFNQQDGATKKLIVSVGLFTAALGPALTHIGAMLQLVSVLMKLTFGWAGSLLLAAGACAIVTDAVLNLTGKGNLGLIDMIGNFRIGGSKIRTYLEGAAIATAERWYWAASQVKIWWLEVEETFVNVGGKIAHGVLSSIQKVVDGFYRIAEAGYAVGAVTDEQIAKIAEQKKTLADMLTGASTVVDRAAHDSIKSISGQILEEKRMFSELRGELAKSQAEVQANDKKDTKRPIGIPGAPGMVNAALGALGSFVSGIGGSSSGSVTAKVGETWKKSLELSMLQATGKVGRDFSVKAEDEAGRGEKGTKAALRALAEASPGYDFGGASKLFGDMAGGGDTGSEADRARQIANFREKLRLGGPTRTSSNAEFREVSLRHFAIEGPGGLARDTSVARKPEIVAPKVESLLEEIKAVLKNGQVGLYGAG